MKDHRVLDAAADRPDLTKKGLLKIHDVTYSDSGVYSCIGNVFVCVCVCVCVHLHLCETLCRVCRTGGSPILFCFVFFFCRSRLAVSAVDSRKTWRTHTKKKQK